MAEYNYPKDGRIHTRYSELTKCGTAYSAIKQAERKLSRRIERKGDAMAFGTLMHELWREEAQVTGWTPAVFAEHLDFAKPVAVTERHLATTPFKDVVIHFTADVITTDGDLVDYKTTGSTVDHYTPAMQLPVYAYLLMPHGYAVRNAHYLIQRWDPERTEIKGYKRHTKKIGVAEMALAKRWLGARVSMLVAAIEHVKQQNPQAYVNDDFQLPDFELADVEII